MFTNATTSYEMPLNENVIDKGKVNYTTCIKENKKCYINIETVKKFVDINYKLTKAEGDAPAILSITYKSGKNDGPVIIEPDYFVAALGNHRLDRERHTGL